MEQWLQLINTIGLVVVAIITYYTKIRVAETATNIQKIETATNSMKDELVKATGVAQHAVGKEEGRVEAANTAAILAKGILQGKEEK